MPRARVRETASTANSGGARRQRYVDDRGLVRENPGIMRILRRARIRVVSGLFAAGGLLFAGGCSADPQVNAAAAALTSNILTRIAQNAISELVANAFNVPSTTGLGGLTGL